MRALSFDGGRDHTSGDRKYMLYIPLGTDEELSVSCGRGDVGGVMWEGVRVDEVKWEKRGCEEVKSVGGGGVR